MKRKYNYIVTIGIATFVILSNCSTIKPVLTEKTKQNSYIIINNPTYTERKLTTFSVIMIPVTPLAAVAASYQFYGDDDEVAANCFIGGAIGWVLGNWITTAIFGPRKKGIPKNEFEASEWLKKYNRKSKKELILVSYNNGILTTLPPNSKNTFIAYSIDDFKNYIRIFPNSQYSPNVFKSCLSHLNNNEIMELMKLYPNNSCMEAAQDELLNKSTTVNECGKISKKYTRLYNLSEEKAALLVSNMQDVINYKYYFEESSNTEKMISNVVPKLYRYELPQLIKTYPNVSTINQAKIKFIVESSSFNGTLDAISRFPEIKKYGERNLAKFSTTIKQKNIYLKNYPKGYSSNNFRNDIAEYEKEMERRANEFTFIPLLKRLYSDNAKPVFILSKLKQISNEYPQDLSEVQLNILKHVRFVTTTRIVQNYESGGIATFFKGTTFSHKSNVGSVYKNELIWVLNPEESVGGFNDYISPIYDPDNLVLS